MINDTILKNEKQGRKRIPYKIRAHAHTRENLKKEIWRISERMT